MPEILGTGGVLNPLRYLLGTEPFWLVNGDIVVAFVDGEFTIKYLDLSHKEQGYIELRPANKLFPTIRIDDTDNFEVWGVVVWTIKNWKR